MADVVQQHPGSGDILLSSLFPDGVVSKSAATAITLLRQQRDANSDMIVKLSVDLMGLNDYCNIVKEEHKLELLSKQEHTTVLRATINDTVADVKILLDKLVASLSKHNEPKPNNPANNAHNEMIKECLDLIEAFCGEIYTKTTL